MIGLDRLMKIKGVVAAGQFSTDGKVIRAVGALSEDIMEETAKLCANQNRKLDETARVFSMKSSMEWEPLVGWAVWGGKYAVVVAGNTGVFIDAKYVDMNELMVDLLESGPTGPTQLGD